MRILVTGGAGFIGSALVRYLIDETEHTVINVDKLTYAGSRESLGQANTHPRHHFEQLDICDARAMATVLESHQPDAVMHLAAESHVDRSIDSPAEFIQTNILGTYTLLEASLDYWRSSKKPRETFRFHHVSTDEVYGDLDLAQPAFEETSPYDPSSPYAASKAAADHLVNAWHRTFGLPVVVSNCTNNFGPFQFPEKLIPLTIAKAISGEPIPVYGKGENVRDWMFVDDHVDALYTILRRGGLGESYNISARAERANIELVRDICGLLDELRPDDPTVPHANLITFVDDRPGHDLRYAMSASKLYETLGWRPRIGLAEGLRRTIAWYLENENWSRAVTTGSDAIRRRGVSR